MIHVIFTQKLFRTSAFFFYIPFHDYICYNDSAQRFLQNDLMSEATKYLGPNVNQRVFLSECQTEERILRIFRNEPTHCWFWLLHTSCKVQRYTECLVFSFMSCRASKTRTRLWVFRAKQTLLILVGGQVVLPTQSISI